MPLKRRMPTSLEGTSALFIARYTASVNQTSPASVIPSSRAAMFTASPKTSLSRSATSPALNATRIVIRSEGPRVAFQAARTLCISRPQSTAFVGDVNVTRRASPMVFTSRPPYCAVTGSRRSSWTARSSSRLSREVDEVRSVKPWMSVNMTVRTRLLMG